MDKRQIGALAAVLLTVWGAVEFIRLERMWNSQFRDPYLVKVQNDRLGVVRDIIPADAVVGYITDMEPNSIQWNAAFNSAQYELAPRILEVGVNREWLLANFAGKGDFPAFAQANGFRVERDLGNGVAVMRKVSR
jgi:hypothetical protein